LKFLGGDTAARKVRLNCKVEVILRSGIGLNCYASESRPTIINVVRLFVHAKTPMNAISYSTARAKLAYTMDRICNDHDPIIITRSGQQSVVMMSLDDFNALEETSYLLRSPRNAQRLLESISALASGPGKAKRLGR